MLKKMYLLCFILAINISLISNNIHLDRPFKLVLNVSENSPYYLWVSSIYKEVFNYINIEYEIVSLPLKRASINANSGRYDGEGARIFEYASLYSNLIRVEEPLYNMRVIAYTYNDNNIVIENWYDIYRSGLTVAYPRGLQIAKLNLLNKIPETNLIEVSKRELGLRMLLHNRVDIYVDDMYSVESIATSDETISKTELKQLGTLESIPLYMYVNKSFLPLVPELEKAILEIKKQSIPQELYKKYF